MCKDCCECKEKTPTDNPVVIPTESPVLATGSLWYNSKVGISKDKITKITIQTEPYKNITNEMLEEIK